jgi:hypothetical protein
MLEILAVESVHHLPCVQFRYFMVASGTRQNVGKQHTDLLVGSGNDVSSFYNRYFMFLKKAGH